MAWMRSLLAADPLIPKPTREAIARGEERAREDLVALGLNECEAAELLDERPDFRTRGWALDRCAE